MVDGDRYLQSGKRHLTKIKDEESGAGPRTFWKALHGPHVIDPTIVTISDSSDEE